MNYQTKKLDPTNKQDFATALNLLRQGELVAVPTETVYGLAADARNEEAVKKIFSAKNRPANHPLIVHINSFDTVPEWAQNIPPTAEKLAKAFWPGPLTLLLEKAPSVNSLVTGGLQTIALRVPNNPVFLELLNTLNSGLAAPSANPHKRISPTRAEHVLVGLNTKIPAVLDGGPCTFGLESTIVDLTKDIPTILRPGPITKAMLEEVLGYSVNGFGPHHEQVAGNMKEHYQPHTKAILLPKSEIDAYLALPKNRNKQYGLMIYSGLQHENPSWIIQWMSTNKNEYAKELYETLHALDIMKLDEIIIETPPHDAEWADIHDRLSKATHQNN